MNDDATLSYEPGGCAFMPSIAGLISSEATLRAAHGMILNLLYMSSDVAPSSSMRLFLRQRECGAQTTSVVDAKSGGLTTQQMAIFLKSQGLPVSATAEIVGVERKTVYSWLDGRVEAQAINYERLKQLYDLASSDVAGSGCLRYFQRIWNRVGPEGFSLKQALMSETINADNVRSAMDYLRPAVLRAVEIDLADKSVSRDVSAASALTVFIQAHSGES